MERLVYSSGSGSGSTYGTGNGSGSSSLTQRRQSQLTINADSPPPDGVNVPSPPGVMHVISPHTSPYRHSPGLLPGSSNGLAAGIDTVSPSTHTSPTVVVHVPLVSRPGNRLPGSPLAAVAASPHYGTSSPTGQTRQLFGNYHYPDVQSGIPRRGVGRTGTSMSPSPRAQRQVSTAVSPYRSPSYGAPSRSPHLGIPEMSPVSRASRSPREKGMQSARGYLNGPSDLSPSQLRQVYGSPTLRNSPHLRSAQASPLRGTALQRLRDKQDAELTRQALQLMAENDARAIKKAEEARVKAEGTTKLERKLIPAFQNFDSMYTFFNQPPPQTSQNRTEFLMSLAELHSLESVKPVDFTAGGYTNLIEALERIAVEIHSAPVYGTQKLFNKEKFKSEIGRVFVALNRLKGILMLDSDRAVLPLTYGAQQRAYGYNKHYEEERVTALTNHFTKIALGESTTYLKPLREHEIPISTQQMLILRRMVELSSKKEMSPQQGDPAIQKPRPSTANWPAEDITQQPATNSGQKYI